MGLADTVHVDEGINLPHFPENPSNIHWKTKDLGHPSLMTYKITSDGKLLRKEVIREDRSYEDIPETDDPLESLKMVSMPKVIDEWWADHNQHGSFSFYTYLENTYWEYEARYKKGKLEEILLLEPEDENEY